MTKIDFYLLASEDPATRWDFCCRLTEKVSSLGHRILISVDSLDEANHIDQLLWSFKPESFIPHRLILDSSKPTLPVEITYDHTVGDHRDVLLNLGKGIPEFFGSFSRLSEFVTEDNATKEWSREHYRFYRNQGYSIDTRPIDARHLR